MNEEQWQKWLDEIKANYGAAKENVLSSPPKQGLGIDNIFSGVGGMQNFFPGPGMTGVKPKSSLNLNLTGGTEGAAGGFLKNAGSPWAMGAAALNSMVSSAIRPTEANMKFLQRNTGIAKSMKTQNTINEIRGQVGSLAMATGNPIAMAVAGADTIGRTVDKVTKDEFGIYKSGFAQVADKVLDPIGTITELFGPNQKELKKARDTFYNIETKNSIADMRDLGAGTQSLLPKYSAPSYGSGRMWGGSGMKLRTKFSM